MKFFISICIFSILLGITSIIKTKTRIIEKKIHKLDKDISLVKKDLHETELDYFYLSSPKNLTDKVEQLALIEYVPMDFSRIYLNSKDFFDARKKFSTLKKFDEKKIKKK